MISGAAIFHNIEKDSLMEIPYMAAKVSKQALGILTGKGVKSGYPWFNQDWSLECNSTITYSIFCIGESFLMISDIFKPSQI